MIIVVFSLLLYNQYVKKLLYRQAIPNSINVDATGLLSLIPNFHYGSLENVSQKIRYLSSSEGVQLLQRREIFRTLNGDGFFPLQVRQHLVRREPR